MAISLSALANLNELPIYINIFLRLISIFFVLATTFIFAGIVKRFLEKHIESSKILKVDATQYTVLKHVISGSIYLFGIGISIYMVPSLRTLAVSLLAGAGVIAVVIGFASQQAFSNIISGIFIAVFKPFRVKDRIKIGSGISGIVEDITLRHTIIKNYENKRIIVPNSVISNEIIENLSLVDEKICKFFEIGISYDSNINKAMKIMQKEAMKHPDFLDARSEEEKANNSPAVAVRVIGFGDSSVNLRAWVWVANPSAAFRLGTDLNKSVKERFDKEGIEIPFPYRTIVYKTKKRK